MRSFTAGPNEEGMRLSRFVQSVTWQLPNSLLYKSFRNKRIKVNGKRAQPDTRLHQRDVVELYLNDEFFKAKPQPSLAAGAPPDENPPFSIVWEDPNIAILYKPAGVLSHSDVLGQPSLLSGYINHLRATGEYDPAVENTFAPALCNRLDRNTEGLVIAAKTYPALRDMNELIRQGLVQKIYLCVTAGAPPEGVHKAWLTRNMDNHMVAVTQDEQPGAKPITTGVQVLEQKERLTLCEVALHTGRTHQIRAHLAFLGAPILADKKYGGPPAGHSFPLPGQALCAWRLHFTHRLPNSNVCASLAGQSFTAQQAILPQWWHKYSKSQT